MAWKPDKLNEFIDSRKCVSTLAGVFIVAAFVAANSGGFVWSRHGHGMFFSLSQLLLENRLFSVLLNVSGVLFSATLLLALNKMFGFVRNYSFILASAFLTLEIANPFVCAHFCAGTALCLVGIAVIFELFVQYQRAHRAQHSIYLIFTILSTCCMFQYAFAFLIPVFIVGFIQMRAMNFKGVCAMMLGLITPVWIAMGFSLASPSEFQWPDVAGIWTLPELSRSGLIAVITTVVVAITSIVFTLINLHTILNYRLQLRVYNAFFVMLSALVIVAMCVDYRELMTYVPILNMCLSVQIAHFFTMSQSPQRFVIPVTLAALSLISFIAQVYA